jgi:hypothetical protein
MKERQILKTVEARETSDGAGVRLRRAIGTRELDHLDPFLLFDEFRSDRADDYVAGFPDHPHRGFETVTYMLAGRMEHRDHAGNQGDLVAGSIQWMTAGRGIVHSEMPRQEDGLMWGFQLWINLPSALKMSPPRYQDIPPGAVPLVEANGSRVRVLAGEHRGVVGPVAGIPTDPLYLDIVLAPSARLIHEIPPGYNAFAYVVDGALGIGSGSEVGSGRLAVLGEGEAAAFTAGEADARVLLLAARPIGEPIARYGPFVMNTAEEIRQAVRDLEQGTFLK